MSKTNDSLDINEVEINGIKYVKKDSISSEKLAVDTNGLPYVIIRTYSAGVHAGYLKERNGKEVTLLKSRRIWYWDGAASLSQLAIDGVSKPGNCKFAMELESIFLSEAIEIIPTAEKAMLNIQKVSCWKQ